MTLGTNTRWLVVVIVVVAVGAVCSVDGFQQYACQKSDKIGSSLRKDSRLSALYSSIEASSAEIDAETAFSECKPCFYRAPDGSWTQRIHLSQLQVGQRLTGKVVQELLDGKTGPKLFFDCGVGRTDRKGNWHIVNGMMRLGGKTGRSKASVAQKRATRLRQKAEVELYVSRIRPSCGRLEVCATEEEAERYGKMEPKVPASALVPGQELEGTVIRVLPYGIFVDVGASRSGLLHIKKVADLYGQYIDKETGLEEAGLERGARIRVAVASNEGKRLFLDFTPDVKEQAAEDDRARQEQDTKPQEAAAAASPAIMVQDAIEMSEEEAAAWSAYAAGEVDSSAAVQEEDEGDYDEDAAIEDAFGLGTY